MYIPGDLPLVAPRFSYFRATLKYSGVDLTDGVFEAHIRSRFDIAGDPLVDLDTVLDIEEQGITFVSAATVEGVTTSTLSMHIDEDVMKFLPLSEDLGFAPGLDVVLAWDIHITPDGGLKRVYDRGTFTVLAGATQPVEWS